MNVASNILILSRRIALSVTMMTLLACSSAGAATLASGEVFTFPAAAAATTSQLDAAAAKATMSGAAQPSTTLAVADPGDDRENSKSTGWFVYEHQTVADVVNTATANNARVVDLFVENTNPIQLTATYVSNTGSYAKTWWFLANTTTTDLLNFVVNNNARIIVLKTFNDPAPGGDVRNYAIMVSNTGADTKTWWFYKAQTVASLTALWQANNARLVQVHSYVKGGVTNYDAVMISNTGSDARTWWWYVNATPADISTHIAANDARLIDLDIDPTTGNLNAIMTSCSAGCPAWWWYTGLSTANLLNTVLANNARIIEANVVPGCGDQCWTIIAVANATVDIDGNGAYNGLTDGLLIIRYMLGLTGTALTNRAVDAGGSRAAATAALDYLTRMRPMMDVDGNGSLDAHTDGLILARYLLGIRGSALTAGALGPGARRTTVEQVESYLQSLVLP